MSGELALHVLEDFFGAVQLLSDGTVVRGDEAALTPPGPFLDVSGVQWKDAVYDAARGLKVRVYRPAADAVDGGSNNSSDDPDMCDNEALQNKNKCLLPMMSFLSLSSCVF